MSELKPCPFCGGEAEIIKPHGQKIDTRTMPYRVALAVVCKNMECGANMGNWYERAEAVTAWNRRAQPANEPLTLEELRKYPHGDPVYIVDNERPEDTGWTIWTADLPDGAPDTISYGTAWLAYRRKPEPEGRKNDG